MDDKLFETMGDEVLRRDLQRESGSKQLNVSNLKKFEQLLKSLLPWMEDHECIFADIDYYDGLISIYAPLVMFNGRDEIENLINTLNSVDHVSVGGSNREGYELVSLQVDDIWL